MRKYRKSHAHTYTRTLSHPHPHRERANSTEWRSKWKKGVFPFRIRNTIQVKWKIHKTFWSENKYLTTIYLSDFNLYIPPLLLSVPNTHRHTHTYTIFDGQRIENCFSHFPQIWDMISAFYFQPTGSIAIFAIHFSNVSLFRGNHKKQKHQQQQQQRSKSLPIVIRWIMKIQGVPISMYSAALSTLHTSFAT